MGPVGTIQEVIPLLEKIEQVETKCFFHHSINLILTFPETDSKNFDNVKIIVLENTFSPIQQLFFEAVLRVDAFLQLKEMNLNFPFTSEENMIEILQRAPHLKSLKMGGKGFRHSNAILEAIAGYCPMIESLHLSCCSYIDSQGIAHLKNCLKLRELQFSKSPNISDEALSSFITARSETLESLILFESTTGRKTILAISKCARLVDLNLGKCKGITFSDIHGVLNACPKLEGLFLEEMSFENVVDLKDKTYPSLLRLSLRNCSIDDETFFLLARQAPNMKYLNVSKCRNITYEGLKKGLSNLPLLQTLDIRLCTYSPKEVKELEKTFKSRKLGKLFV